MRKLKIECILVYDNEYMHNDTSEELEWFSDILTNYPIIAHSNELGDYIGELEDVKILGEVSHAPK